MNISILTDHSFDPQVLVMNRAENIMQQTNLIKFDKMNEWDRCWWTGQVSLFWTQRVAFQAICCIHSGINAQIMAVIVKRRKLF